MLSSNGSIAAIKRLVETAEALAQMVERNRCLRLIREAQYLAGPDHPAYPVLAQLVRSVRGEV